MSAIQGVLRSGYTATNTAQREPIMYSPGINPKVIRTDKKNVSRLTSR